MGSFRPGYFGPYGGRFVAETLIPALDELAARLRGRSSAARRSSSEWRGLLASYVGRPTPLGEAKRLARAIDPEGRALARALAQARGPLSHRRAQDQQRARPGAAREEDGQDAHHRRDRRRPARRRDRDRVRALRPAVRGLHGRGGRAAPGAQRRPHAAPRRAGHPRGERLAHAEGRDERGAARLGHERAHDVLLHRQRRGAAPLPRARRDAAERHRRGGARAGPAPSRARCPTRRSRASAADRTRSASSAAS